MDQYVVYGEEYKAVRDAVAKAVKDGAAHVDKIEEVCEVQYSFSTTTNVPHTLFHNFKGFC